MTDDNQVTDLKQKDNKNPLDNAANKLKEGAQKTLQDKINEKVKSALEAKKVLRTITSEIRDLMKQKEFENNEINELLKELK